MASSKTKSLEIAFDRALKNFSTIKDSRPKPTWSMNTNDKSVEDAINRLIRQSPAGSTQRQKYMDDKAAYKEAIAAWQTKFDEAERNAAAARDAYQASVKLDPLLKKQQDNRDTGITDEKTDTQVNTLKNKIEAAPVVTPASTIIVTPSSTGKQKDSDGDGIPDVSDNLPNFPNPSQKSGTGVVGSKPTPSGTAGPGGNVPAPAPDTKQLWVDYLTKTFRTLDNPAQKMQIDNLFARAKAGKWTEATFMEALQGTDWWQQTLPSLRSFFIETNDPRNKSTFAQKMLNQTDYVQQQMEKLGIAIRDIDPVTGKVIDNTSMVQGIAMEAIQNGWSEAQLQEHLATKSEVIFTGGGVVGSYIDQLKSQALKYGVTLDKNQLSYMQRDLLNPADGKDAQYYLNSIKQQSIDANPWFAASLKEGRTLYDVTSTYRNQMANLLEVAPENITWNDLMNKVVNKEKNAANTFADFTKSVKQDPLWQYTRNAKETYSNMAVDLMKQFGFMG